MAREIAIETNMEGIRTEGGTSCKRGPHDLWARRSFFVSWPIRLARAKSWSLWLPAVRSLDLTSIRCRCPCCRRWCAERAAVR